MFNLFHMVTIFVNLFQFGTLIIIHYSRCRKVSAFFVRLKPHKMFIAPENK